ncbi:chromosome partition protein Smc [Clostridia bacterium]|nr:chromosome partition protein Smc [Clostridia bacterium]
MFFKTLEIQGFKSFADKTVLTFDTKMTAIVGSNGNGKSNISDALRWVMGEQGAKTLRGEKMEDVIFHGTETRKAQSAAKVSLAIDNSDRLLPYDSDEVVITRKLFRTGDSEYIINGERRRLKDVHEMLMGTGLGHDGYSIIGQGRVAEIINSKTKERRELFEEAAGVSKFLHQKNEAERDLAKAEDNLVRLTDIAKELEVRLPVLERQAEKAIKAAALQTKIDALDIAVSVATLKEIEAKIGEYNDSILKYEGECEHFDREIGELEERAEEALNLKMRLSVEIDNLRNSGEEARNALSEAERAAAVKENDIVHNEGRIAALSTQIANSKSNAEAYLEKIASLEAIVRAKTAELETLKISAEEQTETLRKMIDENSALSDEYKEMDREIAALYAKKTEIGLNLSGARAKLPELERELSETVERNANQAEMLAGYREKRGKLQEELDSAAEQRQEYENKFSGMGKLLSAKKEKLQSAEESHEKLRREYEHKKSRFDILSDVEKNMAGYFGSVKSVVNAGKQGKLSGISGVVADIISVPPNLGTALEIALGSAVQNVIVDNEDAAKRAIRFLKETNGGRATFLPLTSVKGRLLDVGGLEELDGCLGIASELIRYDEKFRGIITSILGKTVIAEDIDTATFIAKKYGYKFRIVTLDGQVVNAGGSFTGGSVKESAGIITRKQEIETIGKELQTLRDAGELSKGTVAALRAETGKLTLETEGFRESIAQFSREEVRLEAELGGVKNLIAQCNEQQDNAEIIIDKHKQQLAAHEAVIARHEADTREIEANIAEKETAADAAGEDLEAATAAQKSLSEAIEAVRYKALSAEKDLENLGKEKTEILRQQENLGKDTELIEREVTELLSGNENLLLEIAAVRKTAAEKSAHFDKSRAEIEALQAKSNQAELLSTETNKAIREKMNDREKFATALALEKEKKKASIHESENIKTSLWEKYELPPTEAAEKANAFISEQNAGEQKSGVFDIRQAKNDLAVLRRKISELGTVNFAAIEEFEEVGERYGLLSGQLRDIEKAKSDLLKLIDELTESIKLRFMEAFDAINIHFGRIFREIFGGGEARLELCEPDDILSSGIEIFAAPPGKLIKNLISLSGGEQTMVAVTIYFAILLHRPTPFCMLDEVDAALDEVNVIKYISYLKRFSANTQLMIITHRRGTIEGCEVLYGVFMQEKGVSRLLRQDIGDALPELEQQE